MTKKIGMLVVSGALILLPSRALTKDEGVDSYEGPPTGVAVDTASPPTPAPADLPPTPPPAQPPPPQAQASTRSNLPAGQWVYTGQYGWVWMPYASAYTWVPEDGWGEPWVYAYYPYYGWCWLTAPWVWGIGPWPYFGVYGPGYFSWYVSGWWREPARWHYAPSRPGGYVRPPGRPLPGAAVRPAPTTTRGTTVHAPFPAERGGFARPMGGGFERGGGPGSGFERGGGFGRGAPPRVGRGR